MMNVLQWMLRYDQRERCSPLDVIKLPYFKDIVVYKKEENKYYIKQLKQRRRSGKSWTELQLLF